MLRRSSDKEDPQADSYSRVSDVWTNRTSLTEFSTSMLSKSALYFEKNEALDKLNPD